MPAAAARARERIGRFEIERELGRGAQGAVYLATDTRLGRKVALKTVQLGAGADRGRLLGTLLDEARIVSTLAHPNIVTLYDAGEERGAAYLVFEYVQGRTLAALLREQSRLKIARAVEIALGIARGAGYAHGRSIVHRDLKPANVMLTAEGVARLMDFGIATRASPDADAGAPITGTPSYMAPEYITERSFTPASDVFALGVILYEMLTGAPPVRSPDPYHTLERIVHEPLRPPSQSNAGVDERLDALVMKALAKQPAGRYPDGASFAEALSAYLQPEAPPPRTEGSDATLEFLLRRVRHKSDFPALSATIGAVNRVVASDREPLSALCNSILKDFALTNRLLKTVNAAYFTQYGGSIGTVSRAIAILGMEGVRNVAMSLLLFEHLHDRANAAALKDEAVATYFSAMLARQMVRRLGIRDAEQAFICAMFHRLGRMLATFYLHDEAQAVERLMQARGLDEQRASREVLGISYEDLGAGVAKAWNFPPAIVDSMHPVKGPLKERPASESEKLRVLAGLSNELADAVRAGSESERQGRLEALVRQYGAATGVTQDSLAESVKASADALAREAEGLGIYPGHSAFLVAARAWAASADAPSAAEAAQATITPAPAGTALAADTRRIVAETLLPNADPAQLLPPAGARAPGNRHAALAAGVQDITNTLVGEFQLNDVLRIILETMFRGIGFKRVLLFVLDPKRQALRCRFGFGADAEAVVQRGTAIPLGGPRDLFFAAVVQGADLCIEDLESERIRHYVPAWYRASMSARGMALLPIVSNRRTVGLIYADADDADTLRFSPEELNLLKTLRNQAVLAMRPRA
jgi:serine/threonine protein kinase